MESDDEKIDDREEVLTENADELEVDDEILASDDEGVKVGVWPVPADSEVGRPMTSPLKLSTIPLRMVEAAYRTAPEAPKKPERVVVRASPFTTGLLARMAQRGGVRAPKPKLAASWMDELLEPIFD